MQFSFEHVASRSGIKVETRPDCGLCLVKDGKEYLFKGDRVSTHKLIHSYYQEGKKYKLTWPRADPPRLSVEEQFDAYLEAKKVRKGPSSCGYTPWGGVFTSRIEDIFDDDGGLILSKSLSEAKRGGDFHFEVHSLVMSVNAVLDGLKTHGIPKPRVMRLEGPNRLIVVSRYPGAANGLSPPLSMAAVLLPEFTTTPDISDYSHLEAREKPAPLPKTVAAIPPSRQAAPASLDGESDDDENDSVVTVQELQSKFGGNAGRLAKLQTVSVSDFVAVMNSNSNLTRIAVDAKKASKRLCAANFGRLKSRVDGKSVDFFFRTAFGLARSEGEYVYLLKASMSGLDFTGSKLKVKGQSDDLGMGF